VLKNLFTFIFWTSSNLAKWTFGWLATWATSQNWKTFIKKSLLGCGTVWERCSEEGWSIDRSAPRKNNRLLAVTCSHSCGQGRGPVSGECSFRKGPFVCVCERESERRRDGVCGWCVPIFVVDVCVWWVFSFHLWAVCSGAGVWDSRLSWWWDCYLLAGSSIIAPLSTEQDPLLLGLSLLAYQMAWWKNLDRPVFWWKYIPKSSSFDRDEFSSSRSKKLWVARCWYLNLCRRSAAWMRTSWVVDRSGILCSKGFFFSFFLFCGLDFLNVKARSWVAAAEAASLRRVQPVRSRCEWPSLHGWLQRYTMWWYLWRAVGWKVKLW